MSAQALIYEIREYAIPSCRERGCDGAVGCLERAIALLETIAAPQQDRPAPSRPVVAPLARARGVAEQIVFMAVRDDSETYVREMWKPEIDAGQALILGVLNSVIGEPSP